MRIDMGLRICKMKFLLLFAICLTGGQAQSIIDGFNFGHDRRISPNTDSIPGWHIAGEGHSPQILSDKVILTPLYPGNARGSIWTEKATTGSEWTAEFQFRATGPERGSGNLQVWYAKDGETNIGASSIYTVGQFEGLALVIDTYGGRGGKIRGFLNDGTTEYRRHRDVNSLAFGHCDYAYRNLGRPSVVQITHTNSNFEVTVDNKLCFQTNKVLLPAGYNFGISAATPDTPDSFELFKFILKSSGPAGDQSPPIQQQRSQKSTSDENPNDQRLEDRPATDYKTTEEQFADLHNRIQLLYRGSNSIVKEIASISSNIEDNHHKLLQSIVTRDQLANFDSRLQRIEQTLQAIQRDLEGKDYRDRFNQLHETLRSSHLSLAETLKGSIYHIITTSTPRMGLFIFLIISFQLVLAGLYIMYKRRRAIMPKKYL